MSDKFGIAQRIAREIKNGYYVNLGIGIPTLVANYIPSHLDVMLQAKMDYWEWDLFLLKAKKMPI